jgi:proteasome lid subunit RPN8/RPN11
MEIEKEIQKNARVVLSIDSRKTLLQDIYQRRSIEACGVLLGTIDVDGNWHIQQALPLRNTSHSSVYFEFAPEELLEVELTYPGQIVGVYHSHPGGFAAASTTDRENMQRVNQEQHIPWVWLIIYGPFDEAFMQRSKEHIPLPAILAYHHYEQEGLHELSVQSEAERPY